MAYQAVPRCTLCGAAAIVLVHVPDGCMALDWEYQWLCPQHELSITPVSTIDYLVDYRIDALHVT